MEVWFRIFDNCRNIRKVSKRYNVPMGFNKLVDSINFVNGCLNWGCKIKQEIYDKYGQPTLPRVTHSTFYLAKDIVESIIGVLKHLNVMLKTSDAVPCCVDVEFDVAGVA